jgi:hypothetical protein
VFDSWQQKNLFFEVTWRPTLNNIRNGFRGCDMLSYLLLILKQHLNYLWNKTSLTCTHNLYISLKLQIYNTGNINFLTGTFTPSCSRRFWHPPPQKKIHTSSARNKENPSYLNHEFKFQHQRCYIWEWIGLYYQDIWGFPRLYDTLFLFCYILRADGIFFSIKSLMQ